MRKIFVVMMAAVLGSASLMAQEVQTAHWEDQRNSLSISAGYVSGFFFSKLIIAWIGPAASHARKTDYYGSYGLQYHYQVNSWCRVGAKFNWEGEDYDMWTGKKDDETAEKKGVVVCKLGYINLHDILGNWKIKKFGSHWLQIQPSGKFSRHG